MELEQVCSLGNYRMHIWYVASSVLADGHNSELSTVFAPRVYILVGKQVNMLLQNCIMLVLCLVSNYV